MIKVNWTAFDDAIGAHLLASWRTIDPSAPFAPPVNAGEVGAAIVALALRADALGNGFLGGGPNVDLSAVGSPDLLKALQGNEGQDWILAVNHVLRSMAQSYRLAPDGSAREAPDFPGSEGTIGTGPGWDWGPRPPGLPDLLPWPPAFGVPQGQTLAFDVQQTVAPLVIGAVVVTVLGVAAMAAGTFYGVQAKKADAMLATEAASAGNQAYRDITIALAQISAGQTPNVPSWVGPAAAAERAQTSPIVWALAGVALGGLAVFGVQGYKQMTPRRAAVSNPHRRRALRPARRAAPVARKRANPARAKKQPPTRAPVTIGGWYERTDGTIGLYVWRSGQLQVDRVVSDWADTAERPPRRPSPKKRAKKRTPSGRVARSSKDPKMGERWSFRYTGAIQHGELVGRDWNETLAGGGKLFRFKIDRGQLAGVVVLVPEESVRRRLKDNPKKKRAKKKTTTPTGFDILAESANVQAALRSAGGERVETPNFSISSDRVWKLGLIDDDGALTDSGRAAYKRLSMTTHQRRRNERAKRATKKNAPKRKKGRAAKSGKRPGAPTAKKRATRKPKKRASAKRANPRSKKRPRAAAKRRA